MSLASAHIQKYSKNPEGHTEYFIKVFYLGKEWAIRKRYKDFVKFEEFFKASGFCTMEYTLPPKTWWNKNKKSTLYKRQKELQQYLDILLSTSNATEVSLIREFLEVDENMLSFAKKQSSQEFNYSAQLQDVIREARHQMIAMPCARPTARTRTGSLSIPMGKGGKTTSFSLGSSSFSAPAFPRAASLRSGGSNAKWAIDALSQAYNSAPGGRTNSVEMHGGRRILSTASDNGSVNLQHIRDQFNRHCARVWATEKEDILEILCDLEYPNLVTKSAKVFSTSSAIIQVLSDTVNGDIFSSESVVSVVDAVMEASNAMLLDLSDDVVMNINTNPRLSRPGSKSKPGLSRRPRVDRSPSRASSMSSHGSGTLLDGSSRNNSFASVGSDGGPSSSSSHRMMSASPKSTKSSPVMGSSHRHHHEPGLVRSSTMSSSLSSSSTSAVMSMAGSHQSMSTRDQYNSRGTNGSSFGSTGNDVASSPRPGPFVDVGDASPIRNGGPATTGTMTATSPSPASRKIIESGVPFEKEHEFPSKPEMRRAKSERGARRQADLFS